MPDRPWESEEGDFGLKKKKGRELLNLAPNRTYLHVLTQPSRTGAILQDVIGLHFNRGHHVIEIAQVRRRKQHSDREANRLSLLWTVWI